MGGGTGSGSLDDSELKKTYSLEFITKVEQKEFTEKKIGFSRGRFVVLEVHGFRCDHVEVPIGDSFYQRLREQAEKGLYDSARAFLKALERKSEPIPYKLPKLP